MTGDEQSILCQKKRQRLTENKKPVPKPKPGRHPQKTLFCVWWVYEIYRQLPATAIEKDPQSRRLVPVLGI